MDSNNPIIEIRGVGKRYNINHQRGGYLALRDVIMNVLQSPLKFLKAKVEQAVGINTKEEFWALSDVSFDVQKGEVIGIIGPNGSGKSTLLKILSQITPPTTGEIALHGKVGSLLEVGTGFHGELSGRENIFLNGAILGMTRKEIAEKFDRIVEFAGTEQFLDTPVKYYSSGMYVRLAFSVAAHMEPDILIIDEVLAVGDIEFQKKCLGKMDEIAKKEGRTIIFVSHNMEAIKNLCQKCVVLKKGKVSYVGGVNESIKRYMENFENKTVGLAGSSNAKKSGPAQFSRFIDIETLSDEDQQENRFKMGKPMKVKFEIELGETVNTLELGFSINNLMNNSVSTFVGKWEGLTAKMDAGRHQIICRVEKLLCFPGSYSIFSWLRREGEDTDQQVEYGAQITVIQDDITGYSPDFKNLNSGVYQKSEWKEIGMTPKKHEL